MILLYHIDNARCIWRCTVGWSTFSVNWNLFISLACKLKYWQRFFEDSSYYIKVNLITYLFEKGLFFQNFTLKKGPIGVGQI